jgi:hypothetical protein
MAGIAYVKGYAAKLMMNPDMTACPGYELPILLQPVSIECGTGSESQQWPGTFMSQ